MLSPSLPPAWEPPPPPRPPPSPPVEDKPPGVCIASSAWFPPRPDCSECSVRSVKDGKPRWPWSPSLPGGTGQDARHARQGREARWTMRSKTGTHLRGSAGSAATTCRVCCARGGCACEGVRARQSRAPRAGPTARDRRRSAPATRRLAARCGRPSAGWAALCCSASAASAPNPPTAPPG
jgi:hypothetical protein